MSDSWIFILGLALMFVLGAVIGRRLGPEYRSRLRPSIQTVAAVWAFYAVHFSLVVLAAVESSWHFSLPTPVAVGGGTVLAAVGGAICLSAAYAFRSVRRMSGLDSTRLVTEGIYRWSRNPGLVGWTLVLVGLALVRGSAMVLLLALIFWLTYRLQLPLEEELLRHLFGEAYETYRYRTHRYFGPLRSPVETPPNKSTQPTAFSGG
jgi:protein-S-isoprenylcysteine O-methyltransferase Ste14